jgi:hypothetical protein
MDETDGDAPLDWGGPRELTPFETLIWRADGDPMMRSTMMAVEILDAIPDWDRFVGNSLGGWVALELARRGRARSVLAVSPAGAGVGR